ncbi:MAG TPA: glycosyltransferase family 10 [Micropepsaceae bacterium]|nr:glycosyltransferase family 10 [Micropepsaceae bacterium]
MKPRINIAFMYFWPAFRPEQFQAFFPVVYEKYDLVLSNEPEVVFYSVFSPQYRPYPDPRNPVGPTKMRQGNYLRVFFTGENFEPAMDECEFAMSFSTLVSSPNHMRVPLWVYENRGSGFPAQRLIKPDKDWEKVAREKTEFCNFVYFHEVKFRDKILAEFSRYKRVDSAGRCKNNMKGWCVPTAPNRLAGKVEFFRRYKFTLAIENAVWPGYTTEKLVDPMYSDSIPIYIGDPLASHDFNPESFVDFTRFKDFKEMLDYVRELDNNRALYLKTLAQPFYRDNKLPDCAREDKILNFFDRIFDAAIARRK